MERKQRESSVREERTEDARAEHTKKKSVDRGSQLGSRANDKGEREDDCVFQEEKILERVSIGCGEGK